MRLTENVTFVPNDDSFLLMPLKTNFKAENERERKRERERERGERERERERKGEKGGGKITRALIALNVFRPCFDNISKLSN